MWDLVSLAETRPMHDCKKVRSAQVLRSKRRTFGKILFSGPEGYVTYPGSVPGRTKILSLMIGFYANKLKK